MSLTIKDKVKNQIEIHQHLVSYYDSDSDSLEPAQIQLNDLPRPMQGGNIDSDDSDINQHQRMNQRRKKILLNLQFSSKENIALKSKNQERPLKSTKYSQAPSQSQNKQMVQLKSKIAQLLKQSQQKSSTITQLETKITLINIKVENLKQENLQKQINLRSNSDKIAALSLQNQRITENYEQSLKQYEKQYKRRIDSLHNEVTQINQSALGKDKQIDLLTSLVHSKDHELQDLTKIDKKAQQYIHQNSKLKAQINRLINILQTAVKGDNLSKSSKNILNEKVSSFKPQKQRAKSFVIDNVFHHSKIKTNKNLSECFDLNYSSLPAKEVKHHKISSEWFPTALINQVETFLKKWRMSQNNKKFVNSLVAFIHSYTEKCVVQNKSIMQNQYKSLKKQIQRKANQSLVLGQIMKERQLKIKLSKSPKQDIMTKSSHKRHQTNIQNLNMTSQNVSILVPASNKKVNDSRKNNFLFGSFQIDKVQKDDIGYKNLEKSMRIHQQNSAQIFYPHLYEQEKIIDSFNMENKVCFKDKKKHCRTESSVKSLKKSSFGSSNKKKSIKSVSQKKKIDFPLRKFKIL